MNNSTVSGNSSGGFSNGGGIFNNGTATLTNSTVSGNSATNASVGGGGIANYGTLTLRLLSVQHGQRASFNLVGHDGDAGSVNFTPSGSDIVPSQALSASLSPLVNNGGATLTHALVAAPSGSDTDQRGIVRPQGAASTTWRF